MPFYYLVSGNEDEEKVESVWNSFKSILKNGDIFAIRYKTTSGSFTGHYMLYTDDVVQFEDISDGTFEEALNGGFIHSSGLDYSFDDSDSSLAGNDINSVRFMSWEQFRNFSDTLEGNTSGSGYLFNKKANGATPVAFAIIRPINEVLNKEYTNYYKYNASADTGVDADSYGKTYTSKNTLAREEMSDLRFSEATRKKEVINDKETYTYLSKRQSANVGDTIRYSLCVANNSYKTIDNEETSYTITVSDDIPKNTSYVKCNNDCIYNKEKGSVTWSDVVLAPREVTGTKHSDCDITLSYEVEITDVDEDYVLEKNGIRVRKKGSSNVLKMSKSSFNVTPTYSNDVREQMIAARDKINELVALDNVTVSGEKDATYTITDYESIDKLIEAVKTDTSNVNFMPKQLVKLIYWEVFKIDVGKIESYDTDTDGIFTSFIDGDYTSYMKNSVDNSNNKMLISGLYGGRKVRGNADYKRESLLSIKDLEVGDLIVGRNLDNNRVYWIYLGKNADNHDSFIWYNGSDGNLTLNSDTIDSCATATTSEGCVSTEMFNKLYRKKTFAILRPAQVYASRVTLDYNGGVTADADDILDTVTFMSSIGRYYANYMKSLMIRKNISIKLDYNSVVDTKNTTINKDSTSFLWKRKNDGTILKMEDNSIYQILVEDKFETLEAQYYYGDIELPEILKDGYNCNWNTESDGTGENYSGSYGLAYTSEDEITLYATCDKIDDSGDDSGSGEDSGNEGGSESGGDVTLDSDINIDSETMIISNIAFKNNYSSLINFFDKNSTITILDKNNNTLTTDSVIKTKDVLSVNDGSKTINYRISVLGELNGDGDISIADVSKLYSRLKGKISFDDVETLSGDVNWDEKISIADVSKLYSLVKGKIKTLHNK